MSDQTYFYVKNMLDDYKALKSFMEDGVFESPTHRMKCQVALMEIEEELAYLGFKV